jgi:hypothetical protein
VVAHIIGAVPANIIQVQYSYWAVFNDNKGIEDYFWISVGRAGPPDNKPLSAEKETVK